MLHAKSPGLHAEFSCILHAKEFLLYFTWPLPVTLLRVYTIGFLQVFTEPPFNSSDAQFRVHHDSGSDFDSRGIQMSDSNSDFDSSKKSSDSSPIPIPAPKP